MDKADKSKQGASAAASEATAEKEVKEKELTVAEKRRAELESWKPSRAMQDTIELMADSQHFTDAVLKGRCSWKIYAFRVLCGFCFPPLCRVHVACNSVAFRSHQINFRPFCVLQARSFLSRCWRWPTRSGCNSQPTQSGSLSPAMTNLTTHSSCRNLRGGLRVDVGPDACKALGFLAGDIVKTSKGRGVVVGASLVPYVEEKKETPAAAATAAGAAAAATGAATSAGMKQRS